jgi:hypothetical protein
MSSFPDYNYLIISNKKNNVKIIAFFMSQIDMIRHVAV